MKIPSVVKEAVGWALVLVLTGVLLFLVFGCASPSEYRIQLNPATGEGTATLSKTALVEPVSGAKVSESEVNVPAGGGGPGLIGILGTVLTVVGGLQLAGPKSWANWLNVLRPGASWSSTFQSLAANLGAAHTPAAAKPNVQSDRDALDAASAAVKPVEVKRKKRRPKPY